MSTDNLKKLSNGLKSLKEENLRKWFQSRSTDGTPGWVQVVSGKPCARQAGQKSTPKCVSSSKRASMTKAERKSAQRRKRAADPNQPQKSGAAKPTYVPTDKPKKEMNEEKGKKDACYHKVKARYKVWPSAYASGALVKCRKKGAKSWGTKSESIINTYASIAYALVEGKKGTMPKNFSVKSGDKSEAGGLTAKGVARYRAANPGSKLKTAVTTKPSKLKKGSKAANRRKSFCSRMSGMKKRLTSAKTANDPDSRINKALRKWNC
jgi:hypothetical protein